VLRPRQTLPSIIVIEAEQTSVSIDIIVEPDHDEKSANLLATRLAHDRALIESLPMVKSQVIDWQQQGEEENGNEGRHAESRTQ
jgi:hypothetical protein